MNPIDILTDEHEQIKRELIELETIADSDIINYPNLIHVVKKLCTIWNEHEEKEERLFPILEKERIKIPVEKMLCEHKELRKHKEEIQKAINSGSEIQMKNTLEISGKIIINKLKKHIDDEDSILYTITMEEFTPKEIEELWNSVK